MMWVGARFLGAAAHVVDLELNDGALISASISPLVFMENSLGSRNACLKGAALEGLQKRFDFRLVETGELLFSLDDQRTLEQVRILEHQPDRLIP